MGITGISFWQLIIALLYLAPVFHVLFSKRSSGGAKVGWVILTLMFTWLAYGVFLIVTQKKLR